VTAFKDSDDLPRFGELEAEYEIVGELGRGGTAVVYLARERELGREVAIKVIRSAYVEDEEAAARLVREARMVGGLQHPHIVVLYATRRLRDRSLALIMQYVPGRTLKEEVAEQGPLPFERVTQILDDIGSALAYAHRRRIVHRDIKPENIYIDGETGAARLSDFGIARPWDAESGLTLPGTAIGTPAYMSPEQIEGGELDRRSDLYSLGMVGYEMLTGKRPWSGESLFSLIYKQKHEQLPPLDEVRPGIPLTLHLAIEVAVCKAADDRWPDTESFLAALRGLPVPPTADEVDVGDGTAAGRELAGAAGAQPAGDSARDATQDADAGAAATAGARASQRPRRADPVDDAVTVQYRRPFAEPVVGASAAGAAAAPAMNAETAGAVEQLPLGRRKPVLVAAGLFVVLLATAVAAAVQPWLDSSIEVAADLPSAPPVAVAAPPEVHAGGAGTVPAVAYVLLGAEQGGAVGDTLPQPLMIRVEDAGGRPVAGAAVQFRVTDGAGTISPAETVTDSSGMAAGRWVLLSPGAHRAEAFIESLESRPATFSATASASGPARTVAVSPTQFTGRAGAPAPVVVRIENERGEPVAGVRVRFAVQSGGGSIEPVTRVTGEDGTAEARWVVGATGPQEAVARIVGVSNTTVVFTAANSGPAALPVRAGLSAGGTHTCSLSGDGALSCWGGNDRGQLGDGSSTRRESPVRIATSEPLAAVASGVSHSCGISQAGAAYCWGNNGSGQLGDGTRTTRPRPARVATNERLTGVAAGASHSCGLAADGALYCWGDNTHGQLGDGSRTSRPEPVRAGGNREFRRLVLGWTHTCAIGTDGITYCWGRNDAGQLGDGGTTGRTAPTAVAGGHRFTALAAGSSHTCGIRSDGALLCWGQNSHGQLGTGAGGGSAVPAQVQASEQFSAVAAGGVHSCALTRDGAAFCWGRNTYGQLGDGTQEDRSRPAAVAGGLRFSSLEANGAHSCGSVSGSGWYCWGYNVEGQLGDGSRSNQVRPAPVWRR
jgi:alpha-tubulin suppressor-like RCC1 family protein/tRNA A-37 threonylcarbamoyl transferase component Bud32